MSYPVKRSDSFVSGHYGRRNPIKTPMGWTRGFHYAIDIAPKVPGRRLPLYAVGKGTVIQSDYRLANGHNVAIRIGDGSIWHYNHMSRRDVKVGQSVGDGQQIGLMGSTGMSTGVHLHLARFRTRISDADSIDPWAWLANQHDPGTPDASTARPPKPPVKTPTRNDGPPAVLPRSGVAALGGAGIGSVLRLRDWTIFRDPWLRSKQGVVTGDYRIVGITYTARGGGEPSLRVQDSRGGRAWVHYTAVKGRITGRIT